MPGGPGGRREAPPPPPVTEANVFEIKLEFAKRIVAAATQLRRYVTTLTPPNGLYES